MPIPEQLPYRFDGFEIEFEKAPSLHRRLEIMRSLSESCGGEWVVEQVFDDEHIFSLESDIDDIPHAAAFNIAASLLAEDDVIYASPSFEFGEIDSTWDFDEYAPPPFEPQVSGIQGTDYEWHLEQIRAKEAWELPLEAGGAAQGAGIVIGHIDTGYTEHYEFLGDAELAIEKGYNFYEKVQSPLEPLKTINKGHGGATGSVIVSQQGAARTNPDIEFVSGVSPKSILIPIRVDKNVWFLNPKKDVKGIKHALTKGCHVISMSRGGKGNRSLEVAVGKANQLGVVIVAAAGNCNLGCSVRAPANYGSVVCAGGTTSEKEPWSESSHGPEVNICAPAHRVWRARTQKKSSDYHFDVAPGSGTSYATPQVAGAAALWLAYHGGHEILSTKLGGAQNIPLAFLQLLKGPGSYKPNGEWDTEEYGAGILDAVGLLKAPLPTLPSYEVESFTKIHVGALNLGKTALMNVLASRGSTKYRRLIEEEIELLMLTNRAVARVYNSFVTGEIAAEELTAQLAETLAGHPMSKLLSRNILR